MDASKNPPKREQNGPNRRPNSSNERSNRSVGVPAAQSWRRPRDSPLDGAFAKLSVSESNNQRQFTNRNNQQRSSAKPDIEPDAQLSNTLFYVLHNLQNFNIQKSADGFVAVQDILKHSSLRNKKYTIEDVKRVVQNKNDKNYDRFLLTEDENLKIKTKENTTFNARRRNSPAPSRTSGTAITRETLLSRTLFKMMYDCEELGIQKSADGFIDVDDILKFPTVIGKKYTAEEIEGVVKNKDDTNYGRFIFVRENQKCKIKKNETFTHQRRSHVSTPSTTVSRETLLSRTLFKILRDCQELGIPKSEDGFIDVDDILNYPTVIGKNYTADDIEAVVKNEEDINYGRFIFARMLENQKCKIKENVTFSFNNRKVKVKYADQTYSDRDLSTAKTLAFILRHKADEFNLNMSNDGFVEVADLLRLPYFVKNKCNIDDIIRLLHMEEYPRYSIIEYEEGAYKIKATHGHSIRRIMDWNFQNWNLETKLAVLVHKCNYPSFELLKTTGFTLSQRKSLNFIDPANKDFKKNREITIYVNADQARKDGAKFFIVPENDIIITEGFDDGLPLKYFIKAVDNKSGDLIQFG